MSNIYGLTAHPQPPPTAIPITETAVPHTALAHRIDVYARTHLPKPTYNHSRRVYHYGLAIKRYRFPFADWAFDDETFFVACLLHDIGTTDENLHKTGLSFEFFGGFLALKILGEWEPELESGVLGSAGGAALAPLQQAESVAEAIIRHQDLYSVGRITALGQLLQLATIFDNTGAFADLVHADTIKDVSTHFPRMQWSSCFSSTMQEIDLKPWAHSTALGDEFKDKVLGNELMKPYE